MKKILLGIVLGLGIYPFFADMATAWMFSSDSELSSTVWKKVAIPGYGSHKVFAKLCTKDVSRNGHGWVFVNREYTECGKIAIFLSDLIYGEYSRPRNPKLEKQVK